MTVENVKELIENNKSDIAFIIGNGINRHKSDTSTLTWERLLLKLWKNYSLSTLSRCPDGVSYTELYDILEFEADEVENLSKEVSEILSTWEHKEHHAKIAAKIKEINAPILTTNFDINLAKSLGLKLRLIKGAKFTDYYPWNSYHSNEEISNPLNKFGIWYINGLVDYHRSIRLGLSQYMGCVERARNLIHNSKDNAELFNGKNKQNWNGYQTWLHIIFNKSIFIFGLDLGEGEVFLRWLLIQRRKYFKKFRNRKHEGWYLTTKEEIAKNPGKRFFLEHIGFEILEVDSYEDIYENIWN